MTLAVVLTAGTVNAMDGTPAKTKPVSFLSEGQRVVGVLHMPANFSESRTYPTVIIDGSWTTVKEQMQGLYASKLADNGFLTLAFDHRYYGDSEGQPREYENHTAKVQDIKNAMTYLQTLPYVDKERIAGVGVCASGAYMMQAVAEDDRFAALGTVVAWLMTPETAKQFYGGDEGVNMRIHKAEQAEQQFVAGNGAQYVPAYDPNNKEAAMFFEVPYYGMKTRGDLPSWNNNFAVMGWKPWLTYDGIKSSNHVYVPTIMIGSKDQFLPDGAKEAFKNINSDAKKDVWLDQYQHAQFYDQPEPVSKSVNELVAFFNEHL